MGVQLHLKCDGCFIEAHSERIRGYIGNPINLGSVAPPGWIWSDPWTRCTYCPKCWDDIVGKKNAAVADSEK